MNLNPRRLPTLNLASGQQVADLPRSSLELRRAFQDFGSDDIVETHREEAARDRVRGNLRRDHTSQAIIGGEHACAKVREGTIDIDNRGATIVRQLDREQIQAPDSLDDCRSIFRTINAVARNMTKDRTEEYWQRRQCSKLSAPARLDGGYWLVAVTSGSGDATMMVAGACASIVIQRVRKLEANFGTGPRCRQEAFGQLFARGNECRTFGVVDHCFDAEGRGRTHRLVSAVETKLGVVSAWRKSGKSGMSRRTAS